MDALGPSQPGREPEIKQTMSNLHQEVDRLQEIVGLLLKRIEPVLRLGTNPPPSSTADKATETKGSPLAGSIQEAIARMRMLRRMISDAEERLEL